MFFPLRFPQLDRARACNSGVARFLYDGNRINDEDTPALLDMEDNGQSSHSSPLPFLTSPFPLLRHADSNSFVGDHTDTIDVMVERSWFCFFASLSRHLLTREFQQRLEDVDQIPPHIYIVRQPPCYRCTYALLPYPHSSLSSVQLIIAPATQVVTKL